MTMHPVFSLLTPGIRREAYKRFMALPLFHWTTRKGEEEDRIKVRVYWGEHGGTQWCCPLGAVNLIFWEGRSLFPSPPHNAVLFPSAQQDLLFPHPVVVRVEDWPNGMGNFVARWSNHAFDDDAALRAAMGADDAPGV